MQGNIMNINEALIQLHKQFDKNPKLTGLVLKEDISAVRQRYPEIDDSTFYKLISFDPTYNPNRDSVGNYGKWILDRYKKGQITEQDFGHLNDVLTRFNTEKKFLLNKDINLFKSVQSLDDYLNNSDNYSEISHRQFVKKNQDDRRNVNLEEEASMVFEGDGYEIWVPHSYAASCKLGQNARWCTASTESDYYYNYYKDRKGGEYYILINQNDEDDKYQFHFETGQFMDIYNTAINVPQFFEEHKKIKNFFMPKIKSILMK